MPFSCCSGNFSRSFRGCRQYPSKLVYSASLSSPGTCQWGSSLYSGRQEAGCKPTICQTACYRPRISALCSPCRTTYSGPLRFGSSSCRSLSCASLNYGTCSPRPLGRRVYGFPSLVYGSGCYRPSFLTSRTFQYSCFRPTCGSGSWFY